METISRTVDSLEPSQRLAIEAVIGHPLQSRDRFVIQILSSETAGEAGGKEAGCSKLPDWCKIK
jgi:hypothetical protein